MRGIGGVTGNDQVNPPGPATVTIADGPASSQFPYVGSAVATNWTQTSGTYSPTVVDETDRDGEASPSYGVTIQNSAPPLGPSTTTMNGSFGGASVNGTWNVYLADDAFLLGCPGGCLAAASDIVFTSFDLVITYSAASVGSTTSLTPNLTTPFTTAPNNSVALTATVSGTGGPPTGTVAFTDGGATISGCGAVALSGGTAVCNTTFSSEGVHVLSANYAGDGTFQPSAGAANIFAQNHATNTGTTYCNTGAITSNGQSNLAYTNTAPFPSVIFVGDGVNSDILASVSNVSVQLKGFSGAFYGLRLLLVAPDNSHAYDFVSNNFGTVTAAETLTFQDGATQIPSTNPATAPIPAGTYGPADYNNQTDVFTPGPPAPAPQVPASVGAPPPFGTATFLTSFSGAAAHGAWKLFLSNIGGPSAAASSASGWCLAITPATGHPTTTVLTSSANPEAPLGTAISFTATVTSSPTPNLGVVTFSENGVALTGAPNGGVVAVSNGVATIATSTLSEGDHKVTATFHDSTNTFNDSFGPINIRIDKPTTTPTLNGTTWTYCNTAGIAIPGGTVGGVNNIGPGGPNPSNVMVTNLPGTIQTATLTLSAFKHADPSFLQSLLVGPNGHTLDFFTAAGGINPFGPQNTTFTDAGSSISSSSPPAPNQTPESFGPVPTYTASPFFTLPGTYSRAASAGAATFAGSFSNADPNGVWSLYFDQTTHISAGDGATSWCMNLVENSVTGTGNTAHIGPAPNNHMRQGGTGSVTFTLLNNGPGPTGDPDGAHGMVITGTLPAGLSFGTLPTGTPWNCIGVSSALTCKSSSAVASDQAYPLLTVPVLVASNAAASVTVSGFTFSGAGMTAGTFSSDTITIDPPPTLAISKSHTGSFAQGSTGNWTLQVSNTSGTAAGATDGSAVTVVDTLPTGYTLSTYGGTGWACTGTTTVTCASTQIVAGGGGLFNLLTLTVNVPANSATSVTNNARAFGGGDLTHTTFATGATTFETLTVTQTPATLNKTAGDNQSVALNTAFPTNLSVTVLDGAANPINGYLVTFTAPASGASGTFASGTNVKTATTNSSGVATATVYTANSTAGPYSIGVAAGSITNNFSETNLANPAVLAIAKSHTGTFTQGSTASWTLQVTNNSTTTAAATNGTTTVLDTLPTGYTLASYSGGGWTCGGSNMVSCTSSQVVAGVGGTFNLLTLTVNIPAGSAVSVSNAASVFGGGDQVHTNSGNAAVSNTDTVTVVQVPVTLNKSAGDNQNAKVTTAFATNLAVTVLDASAQPINGYLVTFTAPASGASGTFAGGTNVKTATTNSSGVATATVYTANGTAGAYSIGVSAGSITNSFSETNVAGPASQMTPVNGTTPQSATVNMAFTNGLGVVVKDASNNPVSGVNVTFTAPATGASGTFSNTTATIMAMTNSSGVAAVPFTANTAAGAYMVSATATSLPTVTFSLTNNAGPAASVVYDSGSGQSAVINTPFANPLVVTVKDTFGNPVPSAPVTFTGPVSGPGISPVTVPATTNSAGIASASVTANALVGGPYTVSATSGSLTAVNFSLTNNPATVQITVATVPAGLLVSVDGAAPQAAPVIVTWTIGSTGHSLATTSPQGGAGTQFLWLNWSDGGAISHTLAAPSTATIYTATFQTQYLLTTSVAPGASEGSISPVSGFFNAGAVVPVMATANAGFLFDKFTGALTGSTNPQSVTMTGPLSVVANFTQSVSSQVSVTQTGFGRNRATGLWSATLTVTNTGGTAINPPVSVALTALTPGVTMTNNTGTFHNSPYITVSTGTLAPGASASVLIQFQNPSNGFINFTPLTLSGAL
jgi:hypothetical protein